MTIEAHHAQLALAGWSVGDVRGTLGWYVYGTNGENVIHATAATQADALAAGARAGGGDRRTVTGPAGAAAVIGDRPVRRPRVS
jgi:hypothetical protein